MIHLRSASLHSDPSSQPMSEHGTDRGRRTPLTSQGRFSGRERLGDRADAYLQSNSPNAGSAATENDRLGSHIMCVAGWNHALLREQLTRLLGSPLYQPLCL